MIHLFPRWIALVLTTTYVMALTVGSLLPSGTEQAGAWDSSISPTLNWHRPWFRDEWPIFWMQW